MRILAIGDLHGSLKKLKKVDVKDVDLILLTGDLGKSDLAREMSLGNLVRRKKGLKEKEFSIRKRKRAFMEIFKSSVKVVRYLSRFAPIYLIFGNVELLKSETRNYSKELGIRLPVLEDEFKKIKGVRIINNKLVHLSKCKIGGLGYFIDASWVKEFKPSNYQERLKTAKKGTGRVGKLLNYFGPGLGILLCHQPPYGILDKVNFSGAPEGWNGKHAGSKAILDYIRRYQPKYVFCGHIHEGEGKEKVGKTEVYNLGVCGHKIVEFD